MAKPFLTFRAKSVQYFERFAHFIKHVLCFGQDRNAILQTERPAMDVGSRLRELRISKGLSQRQLAEASGIANSMISLVEQNRTSPSIASLKKILDGMAVSMSEFFSAESTDEEPVFFRKNDLKEIAPFADGQEGQEKAPKITFRQVGDASRHQVQMLYEQYVPGADTGEELYAHEAEEAGIVISGHIEVTVGDQVQILGAGDAYLFDSRQPHRFRNVGNTECIVISACTPPSF
jgi:transcriptional regulator with XRE-family HTH domain